jgi:hypothetical protein
MASLNDVVLALRAEPMWAASSAARELFHSDMIQWLAENEPRIFALAFDLDPAGSYRCHRERGHLDIWVEALAGGQSIVIENKLFSMPDETQLDGYEARIAASPTMAGSATRLLSLTRPVWSGGTYKRWEWMAYQVFGSRLLEAATGRSDFAGQFVAHWGKVCCLLHELASRVAITDESEMYSLDDDRRTCLDARLLAFAETLRAYQLTERVRSALADPRVKVVSGFTRSKAIVEAFAEVHTGFELGWQYQEGQWRMAVRTAEGSSHKGSPCYGRGAAAAQQRVSWALATFPGHFSFVELDDTGIAWSEARTRATFQHFAPDFSYQYPKVMAATVGELVAVGLATAKRILQQIEA